MRSRKAFALLVSLAFVVTAITLVYALFESTTNIKKSEEGLTNKIKLHYYAPQMLAVANSAFAQVEDEQTLLEFFKNYSHFSVQLGDENITVQIKSAQDRFNPNQFISSNSKDFFNLLNGVLDYYGVVNPKFFQNLLIDSYTQGSNESERYSKISLENIHFKNGPITSFKQFSAIIEQYRRVTGDENIYSVPWADVFVFYDGSQALDCTLMSDDIYRALSLHSGVGVYNCDSFDNDEKAKVLTQKFNIQRAYNNPQSYVVQVSATFSDRLQSVKIDFIYDLVQKRVIQID